MNHITMKKLRVIAGALALVALTVVAYRTWVAPTHIALYNMQDFQIAEMIEANNNAFIRITRIQRGNLSHSRLRKARLLIIFGMGLTLSPEEQRVIEEAAIAGTRVYVLGMTNDSTEVTSLRGEERQTVTDYLTHGGVQNLRRLFNYTRRVLDGKQLFSESVQEPLEIPGDGLFHTHSETIFASPGAYQEWYAEAGHYKPGRPRVALVTSVMGAGSLGRSYVRALVDGVESRNLNVYPTSGFLKRLEFLREINPDLVVYVPHGRLAPGSADAMIAWLEEQNVPVLAPIDVFMPHHEWLDTQQGLSGGLLSQSIVTPELDGAIEPYVFAAQYPDEHGLYVSRAIPERLEMLLNRIERWLALREKDNQDKRIAIVYYKGPGLSAMVASGMEVAPSLLNLLRALRDAGYDTGPLPESVDAFMQDIDRRGRVLGPYAQGAYETFLEEGDPELVRTDEYLSWVRKALHPDIWADVERIYGPAPGDYLSLERDGVSYMALPRVQYGNVVLLPQLPPGIGEDMNALVHGANAAPPHPYIASYLWMRFGFNADAVIHFGTHGSLEFTPWKQTGLSHLDWADALIGDLPHPYVYVINNIGEAIVAKRRSYAVTVSHLTPPFTEAEAYGPLRELQELIDGWVRVGDGAVRAEYREQINALAMELDIHKDIGNDEPNTLLWSDAEMDALHGYLYGVGQEKITRGLYTLGEAYAPDRIEETARLMGLDPVAQSFARLDVVRDVYTAEQIADPVFFNENYRQRAFAKMDAVLGGRQQAEDFFAAEDLALLREWDIAHRTMTDDEFFAAMLGMADRERTRPSSEIAENLPRTRELTLSLAADASLRELLLTLKDEERFNHAQIALDPYQLARAQRIARFIPTMREALAHLDREDVKELIELMLNGENRQEVFRVLEDARYVAEMEEQREQRRLVLIDKALEDARKNDLFSIADGADAMELPADWEEDRIETFIAHIEFYLNQGDVADDLEARGGDARAVAAIMRHPTRLRAAVRKAEERLEQLRAAEKYVVDAIRNAYEALAGVAAYREALLMSPKAEIENILRALNGGFIPPSTGGDPIGNPRSIPTGRNLTAIDAERCPTEAAWQTGVKLARETIARRLAETGEYPRKMAITMWGGEFIRSEGVEIAMALYMLGCEPVRNSRGAVHDVRLIPGEELGRPRIDVVVQTSGQFRDAAASRIFLINRAVKLASDANDPPEIINHVRAGTLTAERVMKERGLPPQDAQELSTARVFGGINGNYGAGIMGLVEAGDMWETDTEIALQYINNMGAIYTEEHWGRFEAGAFEAALQHTDTLVHPRSSNLSGPLSLDHVYEFMGGMSVAIRHVTGEDADAFFADLRNAGAPRMQGAKEAVWTETRSTLLNPKYITDLQAGGASSAEVFAETFRNTYGWNAMRPEIIDHEVWDNLYDVYIEDRYQLDMEAYFRRKNPYALQEMTAVMLETSRKGLWDATDAQVQRLAELHANLVSDHDAGCTRFICDNAKLREMIAQRLPADLQTAYNDAIDDVRMGANMEAVEGVTLERERDPLEQVAELLRDNPMLLLSLIPVVAILALLVVLGACRKKDN